jgi:hypothetical protein
MSARIRVVLDKLIGIIRPQQVLGWEGKGRWISLEGDVRLFLPDEKEERMRATIPMGYMIKTKNGNAILPSNELELHSDEEWNRFVEANR